MGDKGTSEAAGSFAQLPGTFALDQRTKQRSERRFLQLDEQQHSRRKRETHHQHDGRAVFNVRQSSQRGAPQRLQDEARARGSRQPGLQSPTQ